MKQHITPDQFNELSEQGKARVRKWWQPREGDLYFDGAENAVCEGCEAEFGIRQAHYKESDVLLSIGQMIEFLNDHRKSHPAMSLIEDEGIVFPLTLCDDLWTVVKEVLNQSVDKQDSLPKQP